VAEFKEFERRFKFKPRLKYGWFHLKLYQMFQDLSRRLSKIAHHIFVIKATDLKTTFL